jgi:hypothetical protein
MIPQRSIRVQHAASYIRHVPTERRQADGACFTAACGIEMSHMVGHGEARRRDALPVPMHALIVSRKHLLCSCSLWLLYGATPSIVPIVSTCCGGLHGDSLAAFSRFVRYCFVPRLMRLGKSGNA